MIALSGSRTGSTSSAKFLAYSENTFVDGNSSKFLKEHQDMNRLKYHILFLEIQEFA